MRAHACARAHTTQLTTFFPSLSIYTVVPWKKANEIFVLCSEQRRMQQNIVFLSRFGAVSIVRDLSRAMNCYRLAMHLLFEIKWNVHKLTSHSVCARARARSRTVNLYFAESSIWNISANAIQRNQIKQKPNEKLPTATLFRLENGSILCFVWKKWS